VLPPPVIEWGELPAQHMEVNFCERMGDRIYLSMSGRLYLDSYGYSLYTFVGDSPYGPFRPDLPMFRLTGTSRHDITWLGHTIRTPDELLVALWLSARQTPEIPSYNFGIGPLKRLCCEHGHLRLRYWPQNERAKGDAVPVGADLFRWAHPDEQVKTERDTCTVQQDTLWLTAGRDGSLVMIDHAFDRDQGFIIEGNLTAWENRGHIATHQHAAAGGFFLESAPGEGCAMLPDTLGVTRTGSLTYADHPITDEDIYANAGSGLVLSRSGELQGTCRFVCEDTVGPFGHAAYCGIRHGQEHAFRLIARGDFFELYVDDLYVQTFCLPTPFTGRVGLLAFDGRCRYRNVRAWKIDL
jgi:hypothetical protein